MATYILTVLPDLDWDLVYHAAVFALGILTAYISEYIYRWFGGKQIGRV
jgi:hypothetical protein